MSWNRIAHELRLAEPLLDVTGETLRRWHQARPIQPDRRSA
jgi:DNA-binding transcriptional MerR regulator